MKSRRSAKDRCIAQAAHRMATFAQLTRRFTTISVCRTKSAVLTDAVVIGTPNNLDITSADVTVPGSAVTDSNGQFGPDYYSVCSPVCYGSTGVTDATQDWYFNGILLPGASEVVYSCSGISINAH